MAEEDISNNLELFRDTLQPAIVQRLMPASSVKSSRKRIKGRKNEIKPVNQIRDDETASDLVEFIEVYT